MKFSHRALCTVKHNDNNNNSNGMVFHKHSTWDIDTHEKIVQLGIVPFMELFNLCGYIRLKLFYGLDGVFLNIKKNKRELIKSLTGLHVVFHLVNIICETTLKIFLA